MDTQEGLDKLKKLKQLATELGKAAESYRQVAQALSDPLGTRIEGYKAPAGYGERANITERPRPLDDLKELLFEIQWTYNDLHLNVESIPDENVREMIGEQLGSLFGVWAGPGRYR